MRLSYPEAAQKLADAKGITRKELHRTHSRAEILADLRVMLGISFVATQHVPQEILDAGDVVAADRGIPRKEVFRSMRTADVLAEAARLTA